MSSTYLSFDLDVVKLLSINNITPKEMDVGYLIDFKPFYRIPIQHPWVRYFGTMEIIKELLGFPSPNTPITPFIVDKIIDLAEDFPENLSFLNKRNNNYGYIIFNDVERIETITLKSIEKKTGIKRPKLYLPMYTNDTGIIMDIVNCYEYLRP